MSHQGVIVSRVRPDEVEAPGEPLAGGYPTHPTTSRRPEPGYGVLALIVFVAGVMPSLIAMSLEWWLGPTQHVQQALHEAIEVAGGCTALAVALFLLLRSHHERRSAHLLWVVAALLVMGLMHTVHGLLTFGLAWSWLRNAATLMGGLLFALVWLPIPPVLAQHRRVFILGVVTLTALLTFAIGVSAEGLPDALTATGYAPLVKVMNLLGGVGFVAGAVFFLRRFHQSAHLEDLVFACHTLLLAGAALFFGFSHPWAADWWAWHAFRLLAYVILLLAGYRVIAQLYRELAGKALQLEEQVQARTASLRVALDATQLGTWTYTLEGQHWELDERAQLLYGQAAPRAIHDEEHLRELVHEDDLAGMWRAVARACDPAGGGHYESEYRIRQPDGAWRWLSAWGQADFEGQGSARKAVRIVGASRDITPRKTREEALRRYELLAGHSRDIILFLRREDGRILEANTAAVSAYGCTREELLGMTVHDLRAPHLRGDVAGQIAKADTEGILFETVHIRRDGTQFPVEVSSRGVTIGNTRSVISIVRDITERKEAEARLAESERKYRRLHETMLDAFVVVDTSGRICDFNSIYARMLGYTESELRALTYVELTPEKWHDVERRIVEEQILPRGFSDVYEKEYRRKDGSVFPVELRTFLLRDDAGEPSQMWAIVRDITERKLAQEALQRSERRYRSFVDVTNQFAWVTNARGEVEEDIPALRQFTGQTREQARGAGWASALHPEDLERTLRIWRKAVEAQAPYETEYRMRRHDGVYRVLLAKGVPIRSDDGSILEWVGTCIDITERKRAEEALRQSELFYRQTLESIPGVVFTTRPDGYCDYQSQQWAEYTGVPMSEQLGDGWNKLLHPDDRARAYAAWRAAVEGRAPYDLEYRVRRHDGQYEWFKVIGRPLRDASGEIVRWLGVAANINELKRIEEQLAAARDAAETANKAKDHFLSVLSHELRTPLTPVLMTASALECDDGVPTWIREDMGMVRRSVELEVKLIDDLLDINRIMRGKLALRLEEMDAHVKIVSAVELCRPDAEAKKVELTTDLAAGSSQLNADGGRLQQIVWNLVKNSIKFTPAGGRISVRTLNPTGGLLRIEVQDTGIGMPPDAIPRLFKPFEQADEQVARQFGGLGLGLAICKALVEVHGGSICGASEGPARGATFTVDLPTIAPKTVAASFGAPQPTQMAAGIRILYVEDHGTTSQVIQKVFTRAGHEVFAARSVREAVAAGGKRTFDLLVCDVGLPDGSGLDVMRELRARNPRLKGIALSGFGMDTDVERSLAAGFEEHLTKPVEMPALLAAVARVAKAE